MPPPPTTAPSKPEREAESARIELAEIRTGADGRPAFALPFAAADIASVEVIDVDLIVVTHDEKIIPTFKRIYHIRDGITHEEAGEGRNFD